MVIWLLGSAAAILAGATTAAMPPSAAANNNVARSFMEVLLFENTPVSVCLLQPYAILRLGSRAKLVAVRTIGSNAATACFISWPFLPPFGSLSQGALAAHQRTHEYALFPEVSRRSRDARKRAFRSPEAMGDIMHSEERAPFLKERCPMWVKMLS